MISPRIYITERALHIYEIFGKMGVDIGKFIVHDGVNLVLKLQWNDVMSFKISAQKFYNDFAPNYESKFCGSQGDAQHVNEAAAIFHKYHRNNHGHILDIGCGTGLLKDLLQGEFEYTGIDVFENMLHYASERGYKVIHQSVVDALPEIPDASYDFVFALSSLLFVEDIHPILTHISRIARQSILLSLDEVTQEYRNNFTVAVFDHSKVHISGAKEDYLIRGWTSCTTGITVNTRMIYVPKI